MSDTAIPIKENCNEEANSQSESSSLELTCSYEDKGSSSRSSSTSPSHNTEGCGSPIISSDKHASAQVSVEDSKQNCLPPGKDKPSEPRHLYSKEFLDCLKYCRLSLSWPNSLDINFMKKDGNFDLDKWLRATQDNKKISSGNSPPRTTPSLNGNEKQLEMDAKKTKDPRERIKQEEQDGIVLSPQRRSFGTGCRVLGQNSTNVPINRPESPTPDRSTRDTHREMPSRRIGSGRLLRRDDSDQIISERRDMPRKDRDTEQRRDHRDWRTKNESRYARERDDRYDKRRRFFDDEDRRHDRRDNMRDRRHHDQRRSHNEDEAPEWFTGGPSSQNEFIELVGFDEEDHPRSKRDKKNRLRKENEVVNASGRGSKCNTPVIIEQEEPSEEDRAGGAQDLASQLNKDKATAEKPVVIEPSNDQDNIQFNIDDYLADILNIGSDDPSETEEGASRLKQFFKQRESPILNKGSANNSRRSSLDLSHQVSNMLGFTEPVVRMAASPNPAMDSPHFFAPISPANMVQQNSLVDLLQQGAKVPQQTVQQGQSCRQPPSIKELLMGGKGQSLEEIEAGLKNRPTSVTNKMMSMSAPGPAISSSNSKNLIQLGLQPPHPSTPAFNEFLLTGKNAAGCQPAVPNNAPTERDVIAMLMKNGGAVTSYSQNGPGITAASNVNNIRPNSLHPNGPCIPLPQHSPSRNHLAPPPSNASQPNQDLMMKILHKHKQQQMHPHQHDPIKQLVGGTNNMSLNSNSVHQNETAIRDALLRSDVHTLLQRLINGQVSESSLINQLASGNLSEQQRSVVTTALKVLHNHNHSTLHPPPRTTLTPSPTPQSVMPGGGIPLGNATASLSPRGVSPNPEVSNMLATPNVLPPSRVSPLMFTGGSVAGTAPRRLITHQDLVVHTQSILQNALLKQELEKAKEKHRKREQERTRSPNPAAASINNASTCIHPSSTNRILQDGSPLKGVKRQSPLAFTPTSVMRKMTAEKDRMEKDKVININGISDNTLEFERRESNQAAHIAKMLNQQSLSSHASLKPADARRDVRVPSPIPHGNVILGNKAQMFINGQNPSGMNIGIHAAPPQPRHGGVVQPPQMHHQRLTAIQPNIPMGRSGQHNLNSIRGFQQHGPPAFSSQVLHPQGPSALHCQPMAGHPRVPHPAQNSLPLMGISTTHNALNNNQFYKAGDHNLQVPPSVMSNSTHRNSPVNLVNFFGRDVMAQVEQAGSLPELPGGKVLSLEEVERFQQTQAVPN